MYSQQQQQQQQANLWPQIPSLASFNRFVTSSGNVGTTTTAADVASIHTSFVQHPHLANPYTNITAATAASGLFAQSQYAGPILSQAQQQSPISPYKKITTSPTTAAAAGTRATGMVNNGKLGSTATSTNPALNPITNLLKVKAQRISKGHVTRACVNCKHAHLACDANRPCNRCRLMNKTDTCVDSDYKKRGRPRVRRPDSVSPPASPTSINSSSNGTTTTTNTANNKNSNSGTRNNTNNAKGSDTLKNTQQQQQPGQRHYPIASGLPYGNVYNATAIHGATYPSANVNNNNHSNRTSSTSFIDSDHERSSAAGALASLYPTSRYDTAPTTSITGTSTFGSAYSMGIASPLTANNFFYGAPTYQWQSFQYTNPSSLSTFSYTSSVPSAANTISSSSSSSASSSSAATSSAGNVSFLESKPFASNMVLPPLVNLSKFSNNDTNTTATTTTTTTITMTKNSNISNDVEKEKKHNGVTEVVSNKGISAMTKPSTSIALDPSEYEIVKEGIVKTTAPLDSARLPTPSIHLNKDFICSDAQNVVEFGMHPTQLENLNFKELIPKAKHDLLDFIASDLIHSPANTLYSFESDCGCEGLRVFSWVTLWKIMDDPLHIACHVKRIPHSSITNGNSSSTVASVPVKNMIPSIPSWNNPHDALSCLSDAAISLHSASSTRVNNVATTNDTIVSNPRRSSVSVRDLLN